MKMHLYYKYLKDRDDAYKRKLQRIKVRTVEDNPLKVVIGGKSSTRCRFHPFKLLLLLLPPIILLVLLLSHHNTLSHHISRQHFVSRWIWGGPDPRYISHLDINWQHTRTILNKLPPQLQRIGLVNFNHTEIRQWKHMIPTANHLLLPLDYAEKNLTWQSLYPEWIDEEEEEHVPVCASLPIIQVPPEPLDLIAIKLPCRDEGNWSRDIARLHLQISAATLAAASTSQVHVIFITSCFPIPNLFTCKDLVAREGDVWLYKPRLNALRDKIQLPVGSCQLALPFGSIEKIKRETENSRKKRREAYATILHSADVYVCGAIVAGQSIRMAGSTRDLVILVDETISPHHRIGLESAGWKVRTISRIRNPKAEKDAYNEWNYSKFRLWQLTDYDKIIFIDADMLILRNIDFLFGMPEISATGNNGTLFNSGVMVIEPSNCTFQLLMEHINEIESYNGGDQGYLNEIFTWWHRVPKHMNFLKNFWVGDDDLVKKKKIRLFQADPPILYVLHYLGNKPWMCFRDYDCNWNVDILQEFASDVAHRKWWKVHDAMPEKLQDLCLLRSKQKAQLEWDRREAEKRNYSDSHWKIKIKDKRMNKCIDPPYCHWKSMLEHWGETNWTTHIPKPPTLPSLTL